MDDNGRKLLAAKSLKGISIGDAFGDSFFGNLDSIHEMINNRFMPSTKWEFTDDTIMAISVYEQLERSGTISQDELIKQLCINHNKDENRGYGATARRIFREIHTGKNWKEVSEDAFDGMGSMGNGAAVRACPIGAYFFDDLQKVRELSIRSAEVTHSNIEAKVGAMAAAISVAIATKVSLENKSISPSSFIQNVADELPDSDTKSKINKALSVPYTYHIETVKSILGNGEKMIAQDTVPFSIWCAAYNLLNFEESLWKAVSILGDRDTICAIVGGITIMSSEKDKIPSEWLSAVEKFETSPFRNGR